MLKNKLKIKKIRNICILIMAIAILIGMYTYVRRSRAENVIQIALEVTDKSETLEMQTMTVDATETQDGNYILELPTAVNGNIVTKYYTADGAEVAMNDENADKTLILTEADITNQPMQLQTDYDKKEVTTEDGQTIILYNKELLAEKKTEENVEDTQATSNETTNGETGEATNQATTDGTTEQKPELDDTVVVTGYMPLEAQVDIQEIDLATLSEIVLPSDTQTIQSAYEVSVYQILRRTIDASGNVIAEEMIMPEMLTTESATSENVTNSTTENTIAETINSENARENENVESVTVATTPDNTTITTILLNDGTRIEEEKIEYDPSIYNEQLTIKTKNVEENTIGTIYAIQDDNQVEPLENITEAEYVNATFAKDSQTVKYALAVEPNLSQDEPTTETTQSDSGIATMALTDGNMLRSTSTETSRTSGFLGNTSIQRQNIENITFVSSTSGANDTAWDVSAEQNGSIMAWYETSNSSGALKVYIGSNETIYANTDSSYLFSYIGYSSNCTATETITNIDLLNTSNVTDMSNMFYYAGYRAMTSLDLGDNFNTSNVTNMSYMFYSTGYTAMTSLDLGDNFDTSNVTDMERMFSNTGYRAMTSLDLGDNFNTSNVTDMYGMFYSTGYTAMTSLDLGDNFNTSNVTNMSNMFYSTGYTAMTSLDLGDNFDTSNVINMSEMFFQTGFVSMTSLDLGDNFNTSNVTNMRYMFYSTGYTAMTSLDLGDNFNTSNVTNMMSMFSSTGYTAMTKLNLGPSFTYISEETTGTPHQGGYIPSYRDMFSNTGKSGEIVITVPEQIYQDEHHVKLNENSTTTIEFTRGTIEVITQVQNNYLRSTNTETSSSSGFLGNTSIQRQNIENVTFVNYLPDTIMPESPGDPIRSYDGTNNTGNGHNNSTTTWKDLSENYDGAIHGATWNNDYLSLDGTDDWVNLGNIDFTNQATLDITFAAKSIQSGQRCVMSNIDGQEVSLLLDEGVPVFRVYIEEIGRRIALQDSKAVTVGEITRLTGIYDGTTLSLYVNGALVAQATQQGTIAPPDNNTVMAIGTNPTGSSASGNYANMDVYSAKVYDKAITLDVLRNYDGTNNTGNGHSSSTTTWKDLSGNKDGIVTGATWEDDHLSLDGNDDWVNIGYVNVTNQVTLDTTITAKSIQSGEIVVLGNYDLGGVGIDLTDGVPRFQIYIADVGYVNVQATEEVTVGEKTRITGTYDGNTMSLYINGQLVAQKAQTGTIRTPINQTVMAIGVNPQGSSAQAGYANIDVYSAKVYNTVITPQYLTAWDVSEAQDGSIMAWYETSNSNGALKVYIGSNEQIYANPDSSYLFSSIGYSSNCTATETITNINLLDSSDVTNMSHMFYYTGYRAMTSLDLGDNFDTSNVTDMSYMFQYTGFNAMTSLDLGDNFDTSKVTNMRVMFSLTGRTAMSSLDLGDQFYTSNVTDMQSMFDTTGFGAMTSLDLGDNFDTSRVTNMKGMFKDTGYTAMTSLDLGDQFYTSNVTDMGMMFFETGSRNMTNLDLGPAFTNIATTNGSMFSSTGKSGEIVIQAPEAIFQEETKFKLNTNSGTTIDFTRGTINPKYRTEWIKEETEIDTTDASNPKLNITLRGTTNTELAANEYISDIGGTGATRNYVKVFIDDTEITDIITKGLSVPVQTTNPRNGAQDMLQVLTLSNFEEATRRTGKDYKEWSGNIRVEVAQGTLTDITYGNKNMSVAEDGSRADSQVEDETKVDRNTTDAMFADFIKPEFTYEYSSTDINYEEKTLTVNFSVTDKYYLSSAILANASNITVKMLDTNVVPENLTKSLRKVQDITETRDGEEVKIGERYEFVISGFEQAKIENGKYKEYSGPVSIVFPAGIVLDKSNNFNDQKNITIGIDEPDGTGDAEIVDVITPYIEKIDSSVNVKDATAKMTFRVTDKYLLNSTLTNSNIQVLVNGSVNTSITKQLISTVLSEQRVVDGISTEVPYGVQYNLTLTGIDTTVNQIKVRVPEGLITDQSGNGNKETDLIVFNTLRNTSTEVNSTSGFLGNTNIQRQNVDNVTFVDNIPEDVYDLINHTYIDDTAWDVSAMQDNSIIAWYVTNENDSIKVYVGSNEDIYGNVDSSYLFSYIGYSSDCTATETITNIDLLNTSNVTNMSSMFAGTGRTSMTSLDLGENFNTSNVTNMGYMFYQIGLTGMTSLELGEHFDTSKVTNMTSMFAFTGQTAMTILDLGEKFDTSNVTDMSSMFNYTGQMAMTTLNLGDKFDTSDVTNMSAMFAGTGYTEMTSLDLGDKFDTRNVTNMNLMFASTGNTAMTSLDLGDKFDTSNVTNMSNMFHSTGQEAMTSLDLGPAFTNIAETNTGIFSSTGKSGEIVIYAPEAIYQNSTNFKLNTNSSTTIEFTNGTIHPKYRTEWLKEGTSIDETDTNNPKLNITLRGTTNQEVVPTEYISDVTSSLTVDDIRVFIDDTEITDVVTKTIETATTTANTRTGAQDVLQVLTLSNFEEATRQVGKAYKEWSGNIRIEVAQGTLSDTTGPVDEDGDRTNYGNKNMALLDDGTRADHSIEDETKVDQNTEGSMFTDFIKPEFTYESSKTEILHGDEEQVTIVFDVVDKFFESTILSNLDASQITVQIDDYDVTELNQNITKQLTKVEDLTATVEGVENTKIGERYQLVITGLDQEDAEGNGDGYTYSGYMTLSFAAGTVTDKSGNTSSAKSITIGRDDPGGQDGDEEVVDVVDPVWSVASVDYNTGIVKLRITDKFLDREQSTFNITEDSIKVIVNGIESTAISQVIEGPTEIIPNEQYEYTLILENIFSETATYTEFTPVEPIVGGTAQYRNENGGDVSIEIADGTVVDQYGNASNMQSFELGNIDGTGPEVYDVQKIQDEETEKVTFIFNVTDRNYDPTDPVTIDEITTWIDGIQVDDQVTKQLTNTVEIKANIDGEVKVLGHQYTVEITDFVETTEEFMNSGRDYREFSGTLEIKIDPDASKDISGNILNEATTTIAEFVDFIRPEIMYQYNTTDINYDGKTFTMVFDVTDKYYTSGTLTLEDLTILIDGEEPDWTEVDRALQVENRTNMVNGESKVIGQRYTLTLSNLEQLQVKEGNHYADYSGVITVAIPADKITDTTGNTNDATTLTSGISIPGGTGTEEVVDVVDPLIEKVSSTVNVANKTATITFKATDKYFANSNLTNENIQIVINGSTDTTGITKQLTSTALDEQRIIDGVSSSVQYGVQYTLTLTGIDTTVNQIKVRVPEGLITDQYGNGNKETDLIVFNTLRNTSTEMQNTSDLLGNTNIERQNVDNVTFVNNIPEDVYDVISHTYIDDTAWDVSAMQDNSIIAWYEESANGTVKVYIGSNHEIFGNVDSSYLFSYIGSSSDCTATETITNIGLLNVSNVTNMSGMFRSAGYTAMTSLNLGDKFDTSQVTNMRFMFDSTGYTAMTSLELGDKFDTSNVTDMARMFSDTGKNAMTSLDLGDKFDTSNVTDMASMFRNTGYTAMTSLDLGDKFDTSNVTDMASMFENTGYTAMTSLELGDKFDTSSVGSMSVMFGNTGYTAMTSLDLGDKFDTSNVTTMQGMFNHTGYIAMTSLDLGPAFTYIVEEYYNPHAGGVFEGTGKSGEIIIQAPETIYQNSTNFKSGTDSTTILEFTNGTINPKYRTEWLKEGAEIDETEANNPKLNITLRGTTNQEVAPTEYISDVTSSLTVDDIRVFIDDIEITDVVTKTIGTVTQTANTRTGAQDVLQVLTLSNFEEATRQVGKAYKEWSGNIRIEVAQGTLSDTTGPADEDGSRTTYGNSNMEVASSETQTGATTGAGAVTEIGARIDNIIQDATKVEQNTEGAMFADFIKPEFTYTYSSTDINYDEKTLTVEFSITDKYFNSSTVLANQENITVRMLDTNVVPENITKTLTKVEDISETRDGQEVKIGERYRLVVSGFEQASIAEDGNYKEYSGPVSIVFPAGMINDKSANESDQKNITIGINEPDGTGSAEIVDVVTPIWEARNLQIDKENDRVTVDLYGTDRYYADDTLDISKIKVIIDGEEVTSTENVTKELSAPEALTEMRDGATAQYGVKYTLTLSNWKESDTVFQTSEKEYRQYSGNTELQIEAGTLVDGSGNENIETTLDLGMIDIINPEVYQISSTKDDTAKTDTIVFEVVDKYFASAQISTTDTSKLTIYVDDEEAIGVTKTITNVEDMTAIVNGSSKVIGKRYTLVISNFEQPRTTIDYDREYSDWSGDVTVKIDAGTIVDESGNSN